MLRGVFVPQTVSLRSPARPQRWHSRKIVPFMRYKRLSINYTQKYKNNQVCLTSRVGLASFNASVGGNSDSRLLSTTSPSRIETMEGIRESTVCGEYGWTNSEEIGGRGVSPRPKRLRN